MVVGACNNTGKQEVSTAVPVPTTVNNPQTSSGAPTEPVPSAPAPSQPTPPSHYYAMEQDGTYGYERALSEDDVRSGTAVKPLSMMRYVGFRHSTYVLLLIDPNNENNTTRVTCQAPCNFAKVQVMSGAVVQNTETLPVAPDSVLGAMLIDAMSGQLRPYGQLENMPKIAAAIASQATVPQTDAAAESPDQPVQQNAVADAPLQQPSFDCSKARSIPEYLICHDPDLAAADRDLATIFQQAKDTVADKVAFAERVRKQWNYREKNCHDKACVASWYTYQKNVLTKIAQTGDVNAN
jgi:hypothetical protein